MHPEVEINNYRRMAERRIVTRVGVLYSTPHEKLAALPDSMKVYCGHEYTESNLRFAVSAEPDNAAMQTRLERVVSIRAKAQADWHDAGPEEMTIPSTIGEERETNPFMRAPDGEALGLLRKAKDVF